MYYNDYFRNNNKNIKQICKGINFLLADREVCTKKISDRGLGSCQYCQDRGLIFSPYRPRKWG